MSLMALKIYVMHTVIKPYSVSQCEKWFKKFRSGDFGFQDLPRPGAEKVLDNIDLKALIKSDNTQTVVQLVE